MYGPYRSADPNEVIRQYTPLVRRIASHIGSRLPAHISLEDLVQEGMTGLLDALQRYQPQSDHSFESYASIRIRGAIYDACRRDDILPRHQRDKLDILERATRQLEQQLGRLPTEQEVAEAAGMDIGDYHEALGQMVNLTPLDEIPEELMPADTQADPVHRLATTQFFERLVAIMPQLPEKQQMVLALHYQEDLSYRQIAQVMDLTPGRISQLHTQAMITIRSLLGTVAP